MKDMLARAKLLGLSFNGEQELIGLRDGVVVRLDFGEGWMCAEIPAPRFPESLTSADLPAELRTSFVLRQGFVELDRCDPSALPALAATAKSVAGWWRAPVLALVKRHRLQGSPTLDRLWGEVDGIDVVLSEQNGPTGLVADVRATLAVSMPPLTEIRAAGPTAPASAVPDPVLSGRISVVGLDEAGLRALCTDRVRGPLLAVLLDHEGEVTASEVGARVSALREVDETARALRDAVDLAKALSEIG